MTALDADPGEVVRAGYRDELMMALRLVSALSELALRAGADAGEIGLIREIAGRLGRAR